MTYPVPWLWLAACVAGSPAAAQTAILWNSDANQTNLTSAGVLLDDQYKFELGVFAPPFVPTPASVDQWAAHWHPASRTAYDPVTQRFAASFTPTDNTSPFAAGTPAYVWGFRGDALSSEWILFRAASWSWPNASDFPAVTYWYAKDATAVVGAIHANGSPCLMQTAAVANAAPPATTWAQWQADTLAGEPLKQPADDPDRDGSSNLLEYVFGTPPRAAGPPTATPLAVVDGHLQITIPRRIDHPADLSVEVSDDLTNWQSGPAYTAVVSDGLAALVVGDLTPLASHPHRFMRLKAVLHAP